MGGVRAPHTHRNTLRTSMGATASVLLRFRTTPALPRSQLYFSEGADAVGTRGREQQVLHSCPRASRTLVVAKGVFEHPNHLPGYATGTCFVVLTNVH